MEYSEIGMTPTMGKAVLQIETVFRAPPSVQMQLFWLNLQINLIQFNLTCIEILTKELVTRQL